MGSKTVKIGLGVLCLVILALVGAYLLFFGGPAKKVVEPGPSPYSIRISVLEGAGEVPTLVTLRLFNRKVRQEHLDNRGKRGNKAEPVVAKISSSCWKKQVRFYCVRGGKEREITGFVKVKKFPTLKELRFAPKTVYHAYYTIIKHDRIKPGDRMFAEMEIEGKKIRSNLVVIRGEKVPSEKAAFVRAANIYYRLGDNDKLLSLSREMIARKPKYLAGYWFQGLALERQGKDREALNAYMKVRTLLPKPRKGEFYEPPVLLWQKIRALKRRVSKTEPKAGS